MGMFVILVSGTAVDDGGEEYLDRMKELSAAENENVGSG